MRFENTIEIDAPADRVWALTTDVESWPAITPTMTKVERLDNGPFHATSTARVKQPGQRAKVWTVTAFDPDHSFTWETRRATASPGVLCRRSSQQEFGNGLTSCC